MTETKHKKFKIQKDMRTNLFVQTTNVVKTSSNLNRVSGRLLIALMLLFSLAIGNAWGNSNYYSKVTLSKTGNGKVYCQKGGTNGTWTENGTTSDADSQSSAPTHTWYIKAEPDEGWAFKEWTSFSGWKSNPTVDGDFYKGTITAAENASNANGQATATFVKIFQFKAKAELTTSSAGIGNVYVSFASSTPADNQYATSSTATSTQNGTTSSDASATKKAYFFAKNPAGAEFKGWYSDAAGSALVSTNASIEADVTSTVNSEPSTPQLTYYAKFEKVEATPSWTLKDVEGSAVTLKVDETINLVTEASSTSYSWGTPSYVDAGETNPVMTYDPSTKTFTANRAGQVTVTFSQAAGEDANGVTWKEGSQTFTFTVEKRTAQFAWANPLPNFVVGTNLQLSNLFSFTPADGEQNWTLTSSDPTNVASIAAPATQLPLPKEANNVTLTFHQDATHKWNEIANTSITVNVTKEPVVFNWKNPSLIAGNTYSWTDFVETNSTGAWNLVSDHENVIPTMRSIANTSVTVEAGVVTLSFTQGPDLGHDAVPLQTKTFTVYSGLARFKIGTSGSNYTNDLAYALSEASKLSSNKYVFVAEDGIVIPGTYNVPSGVTLVVPYESSFQTSYITKPKEVANSTLPISAYRTLKLVDGVTINVSGAISVCAQVQSGDASHNPTGFPIGPVGVIDMSTGGAINVKSGGVLYAWGFIKGEGYLDGNNTTHVGSVTAEKNSTVWECFGMGDWNGGSFTMAAGSNSSSYRIFPFQSYYVQNIEVPLHIKYGAQEKLFASFYGNSSTNNTNITFMSYGNNTAMFLVTEDSSTSEVVKRYDPTTDHVVVDLVGNSKLGALQIKISVGITVTVSSANFDCPIVNNMHIRLIDCDLSLTTPIKLFPGSVFEVTQGSKLIVSTKVYVMDHDDWGKVVNKHYFGVTPKTLSPHVQLGDNVDDNTLEDAKIIVDGGVEVSSGGIFTSPAGANVMGHGGGTFKWNGSLPSNATTNGYTLGSSVNGSTYSAELKSEGILATTCTPAKLHNDAETTNDTYTASVGSKTFYNIHGRWFVQDDKDEKSDHTYKFTYIDGDNTGATASCIYASDKTGLMGGYKWVNVELDNTFCGNKTYLGEDGHYYYYDNASTDAVSKWVQFIKLNDVLYSGSDNKLYTFTGCAWTPSEDIDENCMYTVDGVKKALVGTDFVALEKDEYDEIHVNVADHSDYYMLFEGCVWQHATKIPDTYKAYEVLGDPYIWLNDEWTKVEEESPYYYTTDDQGIKHYYEFDVVTFTWCPVKNKVRITSSTGDRDFLTWDGAMAYLGNYTNPTVTLLDDATATQSVASLAPSAQSTEFTFDLNGHTVTANIGSSAYFMNMNTSATLYITDTSDKGNGQMLIYGAGNKEQDGLKVTKGKVVVNGGRIYMENGAVYASNTSCKAAGIYLAAGQSLEINGGEIEAKGHRNVYGVFAASAATAISQITIKNNGSIKATAPVYAYGVYTYGTVNVNGGTIEAKTEKVTSAGGSTNGANLAYGIYANVSSNATASSCYYATVNMTGGVINATAATSSAYGISANAGQTPASSVSNYNPATNKASAKINITGGTINAKCLTSTTAYGVYAFGTANSNGSNASGPHIIKNCKITASAAGTAYGVGMSASVHSLCGIALIGEAEIENADIYAETTSGASTAGAVFANATNAFMSRAKYNNGTTDVSAANKKLWFIDANNNDGDLTHEAIAVSGTDAKKTYRCKIGATGAGGHITIKSGTFKAKSAYQYAYGAYAARSICNYDGTKGNGEITILGGTFSAETAAEYAWCLRNDGVMNVQNGTFNALAGTSTAYGVYSDAGVTTINGGTFNIDATTTTAYGVCATSVIEGNTGWKHRGEIIINDGVFNAHALGTTYAAGVYATGTYVELNQTKYNARSADNKKYYYPVDEEGNKLANATTANYYPYRFGVHTIGGKVTVNGGTFNAKAFTTTAWGAYANMSSAVRTDMIGRQGVARGEIIIHDGEFNVETETSTTAEGIRSYGTVNMDGGTFNIKSKTTTAYGLYVMDGTTTIDGGTFNIYAGTNTAVGLRSHVYANNDYGYYEEGEAIINGGTFNVNTWSGNTAYGVYVTGAAGAYSATKSTAYTGEKPANYAVAGRATINGGTFVINPSTGVDSYGFFMEANKVSGTATAYPKCEVNGGFFQMKGTGVYAANTNATEDADGNPNLWVKGGHFSTKTNLELASPKNYVRDPYHVLNCVHSDYKTTYPYEVAEAYTITFKDDADNTLWSGLQPKGSIAVYPLTNGIPEKAATATNSFEFASWDTPLAEVTEDATYTASFTAVDKKFMVTWKDDAGNEIDHMEYASGQTPTHADPVKEGYTFAGWDPAITPVGSANQEYTATFNINQYTIRWKDEDGTLIREDQVNYGVTPTKPSNPTKEGYSFSAWNPGVVKATEDVTYTATYLLNIASVTTSAGVTTNYTAWSSALSAANGAANSTLTLLTDVGGLGTQAIKQTFTLELNGHTLSGTANKLLDLQTAGKTLTIRDSQGGGKIATKYATKGQLVAVYVTKGTLNIEGGHILAENTHTSETTSYYACGVLISSGYVCNMSGGTVEGITNIDLAYGLYNNGGTVTITGGTINAQAQKIAYGVRVSGNTTVTNEHDVVINATTTRTTTADAFYVPAAKTLTINGGVFTATTGTSAGYAIEATAAATINVNGGKFKSTTKTVSNTGSATIKLNAGFYDKDTELAGFASPKKVVALTTEPEKAEGYNYKIVDDAHQITFKNEDASIVLQESYIEDGVQPIYSGVAQTKASTPKYAYDFDGWKDASDDQVYAEAELPVVSKDVVYTAHFTQRAVEYPITFANIDGMGTDYVQMVAYGETPVYDGPTPYMSGAVSNYAYTFVGWDPALVEVDGPATYTPRYDLVISHNVSFVINNGSAVTPATLIVAEGAAVERPADQLIGCQHIAGWYKDGAFSEEWDFANDKLGTSDLILYAKWETKTYTITWYDEFANEIDQTIVDCGTVPTHADLYKPSTAAYSYDWKGWNKTLVAANADAAYKSLGFTQVPKRYAITFVTGSGATTINPIEQEVGSAITAPADPTRPGYTFNGWKPEVPTTMPANDVTCVAQWIPRVASVQVGNAEPTYHATIEDAITDANEKTGAIVTILKEASVTSEVTISAAMTIDLNGETVSSTETTAATGVFKINASGKTVTITDSGSGGKIDHTANCSGKVYGILVTAGSLNMTGGTIYAKNTITTINSSNNRAVGIWAETSASSISMSGGTIEAECPSCTYAYGIYTNNTCSITMTGGAVIANATGSVRGIYAKGTTSLTNATVTATATGADSYAIYYAGTGLTITFNSGTYTANGTSTCYTIHETSGTVTINGGRFSGETKELNKTGGTASISGGYYVHNTDLDANCATNYHVFDLAGQSPYLYEVAEGYKVTWDATTNGGTCATDYTVVKKGNTIGTAVDPLPEATKENYSFDGWYTTYTGGGNQVTTSSIINAAMFAYARFTPNTYGITYRDQGNVAFSGSNLASLPATHTYGTATDLEDGAKDGCTFDGWFINSECTGEPITSLGATAYTDDITLYAKWTLAAEDRELDIVDWTSSSITINVTNLKTKDNKTNWAIRVNDVDYTKSNCNTTTRTLTVTGLTLEADKNLLVQVKNGSGIVESYHNYTIPHLYNSANATLTEAKSSSVVYVYGGKLTISGNTELAALYVCPGAEVEVTNGKLTVDKLVLRTKPWATAAISGSVEAGKTYYTRIAPDGQDGYTYGQYYQFGLPYDCAISAVRLSDGTTPAYNTTWLLKSYNEERRADKGTTENNWDALASDATIAAGIGYEIMSTVKYYREYYFRVTPTDNKSVDVTRHGDDKNNSGWNIVCSPLMSVYKNTSNPVDGLKVSWLLADGSYDQAWPETIWPAMPFSYQASANGTLDFSTSNFNQTVSAAPRRAAYDETVESEWIHLDARDANGVGDHTSIFVHPKRFAETYETGIDVAKQSLTASRAILYSSHAYGEMAFAGVADSLLEKGVALTVYSPSEQTLTISMRENKWLNRMAYVWLVDHETGARTDLLTDEYVYTAKAGTTTGRFTIEGIFFAPQIATGVEDAEFSGQKSDIRKLLIDQKMYILVNGRLFDANGKLVR